MPVIRTIHRCALAVVAILALCACASLEEVRTFAKHSVDTAGFSSIAGDYASEPLRRARYMPVHDPEHAVRLAALERQAVERQAQVKRALALQATLEEYMTALAAVAGSEATALDKDVDALVDAAAKPGGLTAAEVKAAKSVLDLVSEAVLEAYQRDKVSHLIERANDPLQQVVKSLRMLVSEFAVAERGTLELMKSTYEFDIRTARSRRETVAEQLATILMKEEVPAQEARLMRHAKFDEALGKIAQGHQRLYDDRGRLDAEETRAAVAKYAREIYQAMKQVRALH
jgi:hypothetical protein